MDNDWPPRSATTPLARRVVASLASPAAVTLLAIPDQHPPSSIVAVLFLFAVVIAARVGGAVPGIAASLLSFLSLNFFFTPPFHTFEVAEPEDLVTLVAFLLTSVIVGLLLSSAVTAKSRAERRELEARLLNRLATRLLSGESPESVLTGFAEGLRDLFDLNHCEISTTFTPKTDTAPPKSSGPPQLVRLSAHGRDIGEMRIWVGGRGRLSEDKQSVIESLGTQLALALEGMRLSVEMRRVELEAHTSQLKAALFSGVTHDIKTPLASIMAAVTSLIEGPGFSEVQRHEHLDTIKQETERLHRVVNNLLDVARLRAGALVATKVPSAIDEVMESTLNRLRPLLGARPVEIRVGDEVPEVSIDVVQIDQVLTNLIENAIKFTPSGSPVSLAAVGNSEWVRVTVFDRGPGISKQDRARIFEPFERVHESASGTGLGLAISNAIVIAHGGRMWVSDNPLGGAAFTFEVPSDVEASVQGVTDAERVLVVEDDSQMLKAVTNDLSARGYDVSKAGNGETALSLAVDGDFDLVILDLGLPGIQGQEVIARLRAWSDVPIIIISVRDGQEEKVAALDAGADDFITKPFGMKELLARMRAVRRRVADEVESEPVLLFEGLEIDLPKKLVKLDGAPVHLTPTEYRLLEAMARNPGKLLTHAWLLQRVWGPGYGTESNYLRLFVRQLRRKLADTPSSPRWITTEPGLGYRWLPDSRFGKK